MAYCVFQRAKAKWLSQGEDGIMLLFKKIKGKKNFNYIKDLNVNYNQFSSELDICIFISYYFFKIFKSNHRLIQSLTPHPQNLLFSYIALNLVTPITIKELKKRKFLMPQKILPRIPTTSLLNSFLLLWILLIQYKSYQLN